MILNNKIIKNVQARNQDFLWRQCWKGRIISFHLQCLSYKLTDPPDIARAPDNKHEYYLKSVLKKIFPDEPKGGDPTAFGNVHPRICVVSYF